MQLRTYAKKNNLVATEVIAALKLDNPNTDWVLTSALEPTEQTYLDGYFGLNQPEKKVLQLPGNDSELDRVKPSGELVEQLRENSTNLTAEDVETLRVSVQRQIVEENAELAAIRDFQHYRTTYNTTQRSLVVDDIFQKLDIRNENREKFQSEQELIVSESVTEKSTDLLSGMLEILKNDKYQSTFLTSKLEQI